MRNNPTHTSQTHITAQHREAFHALTCGEYRNFALFSCFVDGEPAAAIVAVNVDGEIYHLQPLFVSVTESMALTDHEGKFPGCDEVTPKGEPSSGFEQDSDPATATVEA